MRIPYTHILSCISSNPSIIEISDKLFQLGHEHEVIDNIFDIEITPNRGDCISLIGILRDLKLFYEINFPNEFYDGEIKKYEDINFSNNAPEVCQKISFLKIEIEKNIDEYKDELKDYFIDLKINSNNFFADVSNYILYETGQPTHCYDLEKTLADISFSEEFINIPYEFKTLLGKTISLDKKNSVFRIKNEIVNLAGVVGGQSTCCSSETRSVIVECAYFNPESIIGKTIKYDLSSDAAYNFERGVDIECHDNTLRRFIKVVQKHATIKNLEIYQKDFSTKKPITISYNHSDLESIIGMSLLKKDCIKYLDDLGFKEQNSQIIVPSYRHDINNMNDIAEEIARAIGYNNIKESDFSISFTDRNNKEKNLERSLKYYLKDKGFYEVINFPFVKDYSKSSISIDNPIDSNKNYLRESLKNSLIDNLLYNERRQKDSIKLFEISDTYSLSSDIKKRKKIGIIASGRKGKNYKDFSKKIDVDYFENIFGKYVSNSELNIQIISKDELNTKNKDKIIYLELDIEYFSDKLIEYLPVESNKDSYNFREISDYPISIRDISFSIKNYKKLDDLQECIFSFKNELLKEVFIFDFYKNEKKGELKIGFRFIFQSRNHTLKDHEVDSVMEDIFQQAFIIDSVDIPGLNQ